jgi:YbbR domain-containing protein
VLLRNYGLKLTAFVLAVALWCWVLVNERNPQVTRSVDVTVRVQGVAANLAVATPPDPVEVTVRGLKQDMPAAVPRLEAYVSATGYYVGRHTLKLQLKAPEEITVVQVRPRTVDIVLERLTSQFKPAETKMTGELPAGYEYVSADASPKYLRVSGAKSRVEQVFHVVATLDLQRAVPDIPVAVAVTPVGVSGERVEGVTISPAQISVTVRTKHETSSRPVPVVVRTTGSLPAGVRIVALDVSPPVVSVLGPDAQVNAMKYLETEPLPLDGVAGNMEKKLALVAPEGLSVLMAKSVTVRVTVAKELPMAPERP